MINIIYVVAGILVGMLSGIFGIGGGIITFPVIYIGLTKFYHFPANTAFHLAATTALIITIPTLISTAISRKEQHQIKLKLVIKLIPGVILGVIVTTQYLINIINIQVVKHLFLVTTTLIAIQFYFNYMPTKNITKSSSRISDFITGFLIGAIATLLGITGGEYTASYLNYHKVPIKQVAGTTAIIGLIISILGSIGFIYHGLMVAQTTHNYANFVNIAALVEIGAASLIMAYLANKFLNHLKTSFLSKIFAIIIFSSGIVMVMV